jgi:coniferyl-aldehyde dehydrogenase
MKPAKRKTATAIFGEKASIEYQPKGVVGIMTPWNVPVNMVFTPMADALGAGNRIMVKPSEFTPATSALLEKLIPQYFDETEVAVVTGEADIGAAFSALPLDHIIFTGATSVGRHIMRAAAENLTPVTLELGGKSPVIISESADLADVGEKLISGKMLNSGQLCIAPDYVFVPATKLEAFLRQCEQNFNTFYPNIADNPDYVSMINERHYDRINRYIDEARDDNRRVIQYNPAKEDFSQQQHLKIPLTLIVDPADELLCMQDEIFGPVLNVKTYQSLDEVIGFINRRPNPLALYYFGKNKAEERRVLDETKAGGVTINNVGMHVGCEDIPFGGTGQSGMGSYHGFEGFQTFSHAKSVYRAGFVNLQALGDMLPPYSKKVDETMKKQIEKRD